MQPVRSHQSIKVKKLVASILLVFHFMRQKHWPERRQDGNNK